MNKKIVYMGTPHYAKEILDRMICENGIDVVLVLTQPDRPVGRKKILTPPSVKVLANEHNIELLQPNRLSDEGVKDSIIKANPDFIVVAAFGQILPRDILDIAPCINLHASLLPQYRGASPVQQSLINDDNKTGVTSMLMEEGLDTGDILEKIEFIIPKDMRLNALMSQLTEDACRLTLSTIYNYKTIVPEPQDDAKSSLCKKIKKSHGEVDFVDASITYSKYRAFEGWPGIFASNGTKFDGLTLIDSSTEHTSSFEILSFDDESVVVSCKKGKIKIASLQPASKKSMTAKAYCMGRGLKIGDHII